MKNDKDVVGKNKRITEIPHMEYDNFKRIVENNEDNDKEESEDNN